MSDLTAAELADLATTRPDLVQLMTRGLGAVMAHILDLEKRLRATGERLEKSRRTIIPNSRTSHSPPSQDPRPKPRSRRVKSGRKSGGQPGHAGHRLEPVVTPDEVVEHPVIECDHCQTDLRQAPVAAIKVQQKVSGGFRTEAGAQIFARCRSYLDTMRKQKHNLMAGIMDAMAGQAWMPQDSLAESGEDTAA
jgi:hypothetical protein